MVAGDQKGLQEGRQQADAKALHLGEYGKGLIG